MSERGLRDEIERLAGELKRARTELEGSAEEELTRERVALGLEIEQLSGEADLLRDRREALHTRVREETADTQMAHFELTSAQERIRQLERKPGCAPGAALPVLVGLLALGRWWFS